MFSGKTAEEREAALREEFREKVLELSEPGDEQLLSQPLPQNANPNDWATATDAELREKDPNELSQVGQWLLSHGQREDAIRVLGVGAELGNLDARCALALTHLGNDANAVENGWLDELKDLAQNENHPNAHYSLAEILLHSTEDAERTEDNPVLKQVHEHLLAAGDGGVPFAMLPLGSLYASGWGVPKNLETAAILYEAGVDAGDPKCQLALGSLLCLGSGVPQDEKRGVELIRLAGARGVAEASVVLGAAYLAGQYGLSKDVWQAKELFQSGASSGSYQACLNLSEMHRTGAVPSGKVDLDAALHWLELAQDRGAPDMDRVIAQFKRDRAELEQAKAEEPKLG